MSTCYECVRLATLLLPSPCGRCLALRHQRDAVGRKDDSEKDRLDLLPPRALRALARVLGHGAAKYGDGNWRKVDNARSRYLAALLRHAVAYLEGEVLDPESGCPHMAHVMCNAAFLVEREGES